MPRLSSEQPEKKTSKLGLFSSTSCLRHVRKLNVQAGQEDLQCNSAAAGDDDNNLCFSENQTFLTDTKLTNNGRRKGSHGPRLTVLS